MKQVRRMLALLLVACMLLSNGSLAAVADNPSSPPADAPQPSPAAEEQSVLRLPTSLKSIEEEAFYQDTSLQEVILPDGVETIGARAFAESSLTKINLPSTLTLIDDSAFSETGSFIVTAEEGTYAYEWALRNHYISEDVQIETLFPDSSFRNYVENKIDTDHDGSLSATEIAAVTKIALSGAGVQSLAGIGVFTALKELNISYNPLTELDLSGNPALEVLNCSSCRLTALDVSANTALTSLYCEYNSLGSLALSANTELRELGCTNTGLAALNLNANTKLERLFCGENTLEELNLSTNNALQQLDCHRCGLNELTLGGKTALKWLACSENLLGSLDVSANAALEKLFCSSCGLSALDVTHNPALTDLACDNNQLSALNVSQNQQLVTLECLNNPIGSLNLAANTKLASLNCANTGLSELNLSTNTALNSLLCQNNLLTSLSVASNTELWELVCSGNEINALDVSACAKLSLVYYLGKQEFDQAQNWRSYTFGEGKGYYYLCVPADAAVTAVFPGVEISANTFPDEAFRRYVAQYLDKDEDNMLSAEELAEVTELVLSDLGIVNLRGIEFFTALESLDCGGFFETAGTVQYVNLNGNTELRSVNLGFNPIENLNVSSLTKLESLMLGFTNLRGIYLRNNTELRELWIDNCQIRYLDLSNNAKLEHLDCCGNENLHDLDLTGCPKLAADYRTGGRHLEKFQGNPDLYDNIFVYGGSGDEDYNLAINTWVTVYAPNRPNVVSITLGAVTCTVDQRSETWGYYSADGTYYETQEPWNQINCWPDDAWMTLVVQTGDATETYEDTVRKVRDRLRGEGYDADWYWYSTETPEALWDVGDHTAYLRYGRVTADYTVHVIANPIESVTVAPITRYIIDRDIWDHYDTPNGSVKLSWSRVDCWPRDALVTVTFTNGDEPLSDSLNKIEDELRARFDVWWDSEESPELQWQPGEHTATFHVAGASAKYSVTVLDDPITNVSAEPMTAYDTNTDYVWSWDDEQGWFTFADPWIICPPEVLHVDFIDGQSYAGYWGGFPNWMEEHYGFRTGVSWNAAPDEGSPWIAREEPYYATVTVGRVEPWIHAAQYAVTVISNPIESVTVNEGSGVSRCEIDRVERDWSDLQEDHMDWDDTTWWFVNAEPRDYDSLTVTFNDGREAFEGTWSEFQAQYDGVFTFWWDTAETPNEPWNAGQAGCEAYLLINGAHFAYPVTVTADPVASLTVNGELTRCLDGQRQWVNGFEYYNEESGQLEWVEFDRDYNRIDANPAGLPMTVTLTNGSTVEGDNLDDLLRQLEEIVGFEYPHHWESAEGPENEWNEPKDYTAWQILGNVVGTYTVHVLEYAIDELSVNGGEPIVRLITDRDHWDHYYDEDGERIDESWSRVDCHPRDARITASFTDGREDFEGDWNELEELLRDEYGYDEVGWESDQSYWNAWEEAGPYNAWLFVGEQEFYYEVEVCENPIVSVSVEGGITRLVGDRFESRYRDENDQEASWWQLDCYIRQDNGAILRVETEDGVFEGDMDSVRNQLQDAYHTDFDMHWESDEAWDDPWEIGQHWAWAVIAGQESNPYPVNVIDNPILSLEVDEVYHTLGKAESWNAETGNWEPDDWPEYIDCNPDTIRATALKDGVEITFEGDEGRFHGWMHDRFGVDVDLRYHFDGEPEEWRAGESYPAILTLGPEEAPFLTAEYNVTLIENPIKRIRIDYQRFLNTDRYESYDYNEAGEDYSRFHFVPSDGPWLQLNITPFIEVTLGDGSTRSGRADQIFDDLNRSLPHPALHYYTISGETPAAPWNSGEHAAIFTVGTTGYFYSFEVIGNPIASITVPDITRRENNLSDWTIYDRFDEETGEWVEVNDAKPWRIECYPDSMTVTLVDGFTFADGEQTKTFANTEDSYCFRQARQALREAVGIDFTIRWNCDESFDDPWQAGDTGNAWVHFFELGEDGTFPYQVHVIEAADRIVFFTDGGPARDGGFNEAGYVAAKAFCEDNQLDFDYFIPYEDEDLGELMQFAIDLGMDVLVLSGFGYSDAVAELAEANPGVRFILIDENVNVEDGQEVPDNAIGVTYREELAGYMAGYAAVKLGYHNLGFLGGMAVPGVMRYGYGFVQGADAAAAELNVPVSIKYAYSGQFSPEDWITYTMQDWYADGTKVVFACGGGICNSVAEAAKKAGGKIIGVDIDQAGQFAPGLVLTSAMKSIGTSVTAQLAAIENGSFQGGAVNLGIISDTPSENYVQLAPSTQFGTGFTEADYAALVAALHNGSKTVSDDISCSVETLAAHAEITDLGTLERVDLPTVTVWAAGSINDLTAEQIEGFKDEADPEYRFRTELVSMNEADAFSNIAEDPDGAPDIFCFPHDQLANLIAIGALSPVTDVEEIAAANTASSVAAASQNGTLYAYPMTSDNGYFLYYDRSVIREEHLGSLEQILADCAAADRRFCMELSSGWYLASFFYATGCSSEWQSVGGAWVCNDSFNSANGLTAAKAIRQTAQSPAFVNDSQASCFASGAAAVVSGTWDYDTAAGILGDNLGVCELPSFTVDGNSFHMASFTGCKLMGVRPQDDPEREAALHALARYLTSAEAQSARFEEVSWGPSNLAAQADPEVQANPALAALLHQNAYAVPQGQYPDFWWGSTVSLGTALMTAENDADIQAALDAYTNSLSG